MLSATDPDVGDTFTYSLTDSAGGRFAIDGTDLVVSDGSLLDYASATSHDVTVRVTDSGGLTYDETFTIAIVENRTPTDIALDNQSIREHAPDGSLVGALSTTDPDTGDTFTYSLTDSAGGRFAIDGTDLVVGNGSLLDYETAQSHDVTVRSTDSSGHWVQRQFTIAVYYVNQPPTDIALDGDTVAEDAPHGTVVGTLSGTDPDAGDTLGFAIHGLDAMMRFAVNGRDLIVDTPFWINYESATSINVSIRATDSAGLAYVEMFTITITDVNEAPTDIALDNQSVGENAADGSLVGALSTTDPDVGDTFTYTLTDNAGGRFAIDETGLVVGNGSLLDYESAAGHNLTVRATDSGGLTYDETFTITVTDINDPPTDIALDNQSIRENAPDGEQVGALSATDQDAGDTFTYTLTDNAGGRFAINGANLVVGDGSLLDQESGQVHDVIVRSTDSDGLTYDETFAITVTDANDPPTDIALDNQTVAENAANGIQVGTLSATDPDAGDTFAYTLTDSAGGRFAIDGTSLVVGDGSLLDYELATSHGVAVRVRDSGGLTYDETFTIVLTDVTETPAGDFNGDGRDDLIWRHDSGLIQIWYMSGTIAADTLDLSPVADMDWHIVGVGDFDGDGTADILWHHTNGTNQIWFTGAAAANAPAVPDPAWSADAVGDFDADGKADILWRHANGTNQIWFMDGTSVLSAQNTIPVPDTDWAVGGAGDFNGDGSADLLWCHSSGANQMWFMNGATSLGAAGTYTVDTAWQVGSVGDYNGNGKADIFWRHENRANQIWYMNGTTVSSWEDAGTVPADWHLPGWKRTAPVMRGAEGDFNGDGRGDILWRHTNGTNAVWFMNAETLPSQSWLPSASTDWHIGGVGDFNADGKSDILWRHTSGRNRIWFMDGATILWSADTAPVADPNWDIAGVGDFNDDYRADILWRHSNGANHLWFMDGTMTVSESGLAPVADPNWDVAGVGDFDGDGKADILWRHAGGSNHLWFMDGATTASESPVFSVVDTQWYIGGVSDLDGDGKADVVWRHSGGSNHVWFMDGATVASGADLPFVNDAVWEIVCP